MYHRPWGFLRGCIANSFFFCGCTYGEHDDRPQWMEGGCFANFQTNPQCLFWWSQLPLLSASLGWWPWGWLDVWERMAIRDSGWPRYNWDDIPYMSITLWLLESMLVVSRLWFRGCTSSKIPKFSPGRTRVKSEHLLRDFQWGRWLKKAIKHTSQLDDPKLLSQHRMKSHDVYIPFPSKIEEPPRVTMVGCRGWNPETMGVLKILGGWDYGKPSTSHSEVPLHPRAFEISARRHSYDVFGFDVYRSFTWMCQ